MCKKIFRAIAVGSLSCALAAISGCAVAGPAADELNPYGEGNSVQGLGNRDQSALAGAGGGGSKEAEAARHALEVMGTYRRALPPQPGFPVVQPAEIRLMWVPDHLNRHGNLVSSHFRHVRVLADRWAVQDAFEMELQLRNNPGIDYSGQNGGAASGGGGYGAPAQSYGTGGSGGGTPWVYKEE